MLFTACGRAELCVGLGGDKRALALLADAQRILFVRQRHAEQNPDVQQQRMKIPDQRGVLLQLQMVGRRVALKRGHAAGTAVPVIIACAKRSVRRSLRLRKPATGSFVAEAGAVMVDRPCFLFCERETEIGG